MAMKYVELAVAPKRVLIINEKDCERQSMRERLELFGEFQTFEATRAADALGIAAGSLPDLIIVDMALPDLGGHEVCRIMRNRGIRCPILVIADEPNDSEAVMSLEAGANDHISRPYRFEVLMARIRAHLRSYLDSDSRISRFGPYTFSPEQRQLVTDDKQTIRLTAKEAQIVRHLHKAEGQVVDREKLLREVWGYNPQVTTHTLETHIYRLRQKIEPDPSNPCYLLTEGGGYRLVV
jgi:DNA-binding response OmpR family regulator